MIPDTLRPDKPVQPRSKPFRVALAEFRQDAMSYVRATAKSVVALLAHPGRITVEYLQGHNYLSPTQLFLQAGTVAYLISRLLPTNSGTFGFGPNIFSSTARWSDWVTLGAWLLWFSAAHWFVLRKERPHFVDYAVFVLHVLTFTFFLVPLDGLLALVTENSPVWGTLSALLAPTAAIVYWILALSRLNGKSFRETLVDAFKVYLAFLPAGLVVLLISLI